MKDLTFEDFYSSREHREPQAQGHTMMADVERKKDSYPDAYADMEDIINWEKTMSHNNIIIADDREVSAMTQADITVLAECQEERNAFLVNETDLVFIRDDLSEKADMSDLTFEEFSSTREHREPQAQGHTMMTDVVRKKDNYSGAYADMKDIINWEKTMSHNSVIIADDQGNSMMTQEDIAALVECQEERDAFLVKETDLVFIRDDLSEKDDMHDVEKQQNLTYEDIVNSLGKVQAEGFSELLKGMTKQDFSCQPYVLCQKFLQEKELCYLDTENGKTKLCVFNGMFWQETDEESLRQLVYNMLSQMIKTGTKSIESLAGQVVDYVRREVKKSYDEGKSGFKDADFRHIQNRLVFKNCVYDVQTGKKYKFSSKKPYSYQINCNYIDQDLPTPYYDKLKRDATGGDRESMAMIDYMIAYLLLPNRTGKCFFVMSPARDSGKNVLGEFIERLFDKRHVRTMDTEFLGDGKFSREGFDAARLATCLEMPVKPLKTAAVKELKTFTGNSSMEIQGKYARRLDSEVAFKMLLATNGGIYLPPGEMDEAFYRRVIAIPFIKSTPVDKLVFDLPQRLKKESSAIVSKCVRRFRKVFSSDGGVVFPESALSQAQKAAWMGRSLFNEEFVANMLEFTANENDAVPKSDIEKLYDFYYKENASDSIGIGKPTYCSKDNLMKVIKSIYPGAEAKKLRRDSIFLGNNKYPVPCLICLQWKADALELVAKCRKKSADDAGDETEML